MLNVEFCMRMMITEFLLYSFFRLHTCDWFSTFSVYVFDAYDSWQGNQSINHESVSYPPMTTFKAVVSIIFCSLRLLYHIQQQLWLLNTRSLNHLNFAKFRKSELLLSLLPKPWWQMYRKASLLQSLYKFWLKQTFLLVWYMWGFTVHAQ